MRIRLLEASEDGVVAREVQLGEFEAEFRLSDTGEVWYVHPSDPKRWYAGADVDQFRLAAVAWNDYNDSVVNEQAEERRLEIVGHLRDRLNQIGVISEAENNLWHALLQQAEWGHL